MQTLLFELSPELSALEASLGTLQPAVKPGSKEEAKSTAMLRLFDSPPRLTREKLIETIVKSDDQEITLSLKEYVKSVRLAAGLYGAALGITVGMLFGIVLSIVATNLLRPLPNLPVREVHHYISSEAFNRME